MYYQAVQETKAVQLTRFIEAAESIYPGITDVRREWEPLLRYLTDRDAVIVIDEFPYLIETDESLPFPFSAANSSISQKARVAVCRWA